ncbi:polysaccharide pyruvyl transferase CsaB [Deinococcus metallilatus]|uniref:Polysaccharide pyruvyl transferase CsaB n=1 Tax=Deinococcus metallilatus TaxID=1211322 RepID=A0AAJ5K4G5_9DEIO|nr:polysaccharide pyruvyl transferase CsaB [Deinococcus metallilatus]MBB5296349.1 polysaccharide pyruvyl transferase CsaB [Deinococcus metallilatus]QBY09972.1 polysaccharide pyruvyl transferase CsaB [Deinococcus metallilatus]RXJ08696.1 polysaccharide pyruvyl transferase CsaB [Deinococcus metallilatus]TLK25170.1 polysaccharide pyruvyl transferase CsaB [Deinococcus metallilatus]GMA14737.1 polysaccharide pyruvyl transferase CsaB [Deinococcus metallilatus]
MRVVVSGYYGFGNTGDEAIALAITRELKQQGARPLLLSNTPAETARACGCESAARMNPAALLGALARSQVVLSGGGGLLQDKTSARTLSYYLGVIRLARRLGKRVVIFNQSIGPLSEEGGRKVAAALRGLRVIVRDRGSLDTLRALGIEGELGGDPALLLSPTPGLTRDPGRVIIAPRGDVTDAAEGLKTVTARLREQGRHVTALAFMPEQDDAAAYSLGADEVLSTRDPQVALDAIASAGFVVGVRLHAVILAAAAGVPFAGVSYDPKVQGFCADGGAPAFPTTFDPTVLCQQALSRTAPDWEAVAGMKARAERSFKRALAP